MRVTSQNIEVFTGYANAGRVVVFDTEATGGACSDEICRLAVTRLCTSKIYADGSVVTYTYTHDDLSRPIVRNDDVFSYNGRGEVAFAEIAGNVEEYAYDLSGNSIWASFNSVTNHYTANNLNQYSSISALRASAPPRETNPVYDADGNLTAYGPWSYTYDAASQLVTASSNGVLLVANQYDCRRRRVCKVTHEATMTFFYDGWNLVEERVAYTNGTTDEFNFYYFKINT